MFFANFDFRARVPLKQSYLHLFLCTKPIKINILIFFKGRTAMMDFYVKIHSEIGRFTAKKFQ